MSTSISWWTSDSDSAVARALAAAPWERAGLTLTNERAVEGAPTLVLSRTALTSDDEARLTALAATSPVLLVGPTFSALAPAGPLVVAAGLHQASSTAPHEIRVRASVAVDPRGEGDLMVRDAFPLVDKLADDVRVLATANVAFTDHPVLTWRPSRRIGVLTLGSMTTAWEDPRFLRMIRRWADVSTGRPAPAPVRVGLLGYGAIGAEHARAFEEVPGYTLTGVCDRSEARVAEARLVAPGLRAFADGESMLRSADIDLVVVSTPPDTHAAWAMAALDARKHVLLEKPMALTSDECDAVLRRADEVGRAAVVYQNRRWDPDYAVLRRLVEEGTLGEVFHLESFVGGHGHPCNYWHSDATVSGGAVFDWGSHYLDQVFELMPRRVVSVTANNHKKVWHDVTNADHSRVTVRFADGAEAEFIHSDIAAAMKPKWYVLGTEGAVVGHWRTERILARDAIGTLTETVLAPADAPALMELHASDGSVTRLAVPPATPHAFHRELADFVLDAIPMRLDPRQSRDVVAVMEAAERSAAAGGVPTVPA